MFTQLHVCAFSVELNSLQFQARSLLLRGPAAKLYLSASAYHTMPGQLIYRICAQQTSDGAMVSRVTCCRGDSSIGAYFARWNGKDYEPKSKVSFLIRSQRISQTASFGSLN